MNRYRVKICFIVMLLFNAGEPSRAQDGPSNIAKLESAASSADGPNRVMLHRLSSGLNNRDITISRDGTEIFTTVMSPKNLFSAIVTTRNVGEDWDIWYVQRTRDGWSSPVNLGAPVNTSANEFYPSVATSGNLYFTAEREDGPGSEDIFRAIFRDGKYWDIEQVGDGVNTETYEFNAFVAADESYLIFSSLGRDDEIGGGDLYISQRKTDGEFGPARLLPQGINSNRLDYCPYVWGDRFYFTSERAERPQQELNYPALEALFSSPGNGLGDIYSVELKAIM